MSEAYAITNLLTGLGATAFTWSSAYTVSRQRINDGVQDEQAAGSLTAQASGQYLQVDLATGKDVRGIAFLNHNLTGCSVEVRASNDVAFGSFTTLRAATVINTSTPYEKDCWLTCATGSSLRYLRIIFTHTGTRIVRFGELLVVENGNLVVLSRTSAYGAGEEERYVTNRVESATGQVRATLLSGSIRTKTLPYVDLTGASQRDEMMAMWRATFGGVKTMLFIDVYNSSAAAVSDLVGQQCLWGKLQETLGWTENDYRLFGIDGLRLVGLGRGVS